MTLSRNDSSSCRGYLFVTDRVAINEEAWRDIFARIYLELREESDLQSCRIECKIIFPLILDIPFKDVLIISTKYASSTEVTFKIQSLHLINRKLHHEEVATSSNSISSRKVWNVITRVSSVNKRSTVTRTINVLRNSSNIIQYLRRIRRNCVSSSRMPPSTNRTSWSDETSRWTSRGVTT